MNDVLLNVLKQLTDLKYKCMNIDGCKKSDCRLYDEYDGECLFESCLPCHVYEAFVELEQRRKEDWNKEFKKEESRNILNEK